MEEIHIKVCLKKTKKDQKNIKKKYCKANKSR